MDIVLLKYDGTGNLLWTTNYSGLPGFRDRANSITTDREGNVYVAGASRLSNDDSIRHEFVLLKYDPEGHLL